MARSKLGLFRSKRPVIAPDERGGFADGGLAILDLNGKPLHVTPARVASAMRYFLARVQLHETGGLPSRLAITSALAGEGVTYVTRSLGAALAYDTEANVVIVDLNWERPRRPRPGKQQKTAGRQEEAANPASAVSENGSGSASVPSAPDASRSDIDDEAAPALDEPAANEPEDVGEEGENAAGLDADETAGDEDAAVVTDLARPEEGVAPEEPVARVTLADVLERGASIDDAIEPTSNPHLSFVRPGVVPIARRPALAASKALEDVLEALERRFDHLLLDLPPVLATSEAMNLTSFANSYVLVVRQGATTEGQVEAAFEEMQGSDALGVVLNRYDTAIPKRLRRLVGT